MDVVDAGRYFVATRGDDGALEVLVRPRHLRNAALLWGFMMSFMISVFGVFAWMDPGRTMRFVPLLAFGVAFDLWYIRTALASDARWRARRGELTFVRQGLLGEQRETFGSGTLVHKAFLDRSDLFVEGDGRRRAPWRAVLAASWLGRKRYLRDLARVLADETGFPLEERGWGY